MLACPRRRKRMRSRALTAQHSTRKSIGQLSLTAGVVAQRDAAAAAAAITDCYHSGGTSSRYWCYARFILFFAVLRWRTPGRHNEVQPTAGGLVRAPHEQLP